MITVKVKINSGFLCTRFCPDYSKGQHVTYLYYQLV